MPSTHLSLHYHIIFSTKDRHPYITEEWRIRLHEYLGGLIRAADAIPEAIPTMSIFWWDYGQHIRLPHLFRTSNKPPPVGPMKQSE